MNPFFHLDRLEALTGVEWTEAQAVHCRRAVELAKSLGAGGGPQPEAA